MEFKWLKKSELIYWIWLSLKLNNQNTVFQGLLDFFDYSIHKVYDADRRAYGSVASLSERQRSALCEKELDEAISIFNYCKANDVGIVHYGDEKYPEQLAGMKDPPILLYYMGRLPNFKQRLCVSMVGTRKMTEYGMRSCYKIAYELASAGAVVVSGMALGIDSIAHAGAIGARGETVAVLGCGIDVIYPKQHRLLRKYICENGAVITPYHPGTPAFKHNFPARNAIISALSEGTIVVEAPKHSGALITAERAAEQSRTVYALPGSIEEPMSEGPNTLIMNGATAITSARDILRYYFENRSPLVDPVKLRQGELSSEFDNDILRHVGISASCHGKGPEASPEALLRKLNNELNNNAEQNSEYYAIPKIKRINEDMNSSQNEAVQDERSASAEVDQSVLDSLDADERAVFAEFPCDRPISMDGLVARGLDIGTLMPTLTMLEIKGLITTLPGGMYIRK